MVKIPCQADLLSGASQIDEFHRTVGMKYRCLTPAGRALGNGAHGNGNAPAVGYLLWVARIPHPQTIHDNPVFQLLPVPGQGLQRIGEYKDTVLVFFVDMHPGKIFMFKGRGYIADRVPGRVGQYQVFRYDPRGLGSGQ